MQQEGTRKRKMGEPEVEKKGDDDDDDDDDDDNGA